MMKSSSISNLASEFLELSSEQRLEIIKNLSEKKFTLSEMARKLESTVSEVHRNFSRMSKAGIIEKNVDGNYCLTLFGQTISSQLPFIVFLSKNKNFFSNHNFGDLPLKFIHRIGELENSALVNGYVKVVETWNSICKNAEEYVFNIMVEVSYDSTLMDILIEKLEKNVKINSIFSTNAIVAKERRRVIEGKKFQKFISNESIKRKMKNGVKIVIILNEKESGISFPLNSGEIDLSKMFYSNDESFHEWCLDYFRYSWMNSVSFQEKKLHT